MSPARSVVFGICLGALALGGCSSSQPLQSASTAGSGNAGSGGSASGGAPSCTAPGYHTDAAPTQIDEVDAQVRDPSGNAVPNLLVQVCGLDVCVNGTTNSAGKTTVAPGVKLERPAFKYGDGFGYAKLAAALGSDATQDLGAIVALPLPSDIEGAAFTTSGAVSNGDVTLILAHKTDIQHDLLTYSDEADRVFRSVQIPLAQSTRAADPSLGFELAYALAPVSTVLCPPANLSVKNALAWDPGTAVEVFVQGLEVDEKWAPYAGWVKVAEASVSADGAAIETTSGGIPILSSVALRRK